MSKLSFTFKRRNMALEIEQARLREQFPLDSAWSDIEQTWYYLFIQLLPATENVTCDGDDERVRDEVGRVEELLREYQGGLPIDQCWGLFIDLDSALVSAWWRAYDDSRIDNLTAPRYLRGAPETDEEKN